MNLDDVVARLPLMESSIVPLADPGPRWWTTAAKTLPVVARPQLNQELEELLRYAVAERLTLVPAGSFTGASVLPPPPDAMVLLVQPGHTTLAAEPDRDNRMAWLPAGMPLVAADGLLADAGLTLALWPEDRGTLGGNWAFPRGSFAVREFRHPAARRLGVHALFGHGGWFRSVPAPRSAAGPNLARGLAGLAPAAALITEVLVSVRPRGERRVGSTAAQTPEPMLAALVDLVRQDFWPSAVSLFAHDGGWRLVWRQDVWNSWGARTWDAAKRRLGLSDDAVEVPMPRAIASRLVPWSRLPAVLVGDAHACGATAEGMWLWDSGVTHPPVHWRRWLGKASDRGVLVGAEGA